MMTLQDADNVVMHAQLGLLPAGLYALLALLTDGRPLPLGDFFAGGLPEDNFIHPPVSRALHKPRRRHVDC